MDYALHLVSHKHALIKEIKFLYTKLEDIRTAIGVLEERVKEIDAFLSDIDIRSKHLMNGITSWDKIMSTPGNL